MKINEKKLEKENPIIYRILIEKYDGDIEYVNECLCEHDDEDAEYVLEKVNAIREFFGDEKLKIKDLKKELIMENLE